MGRYQQHAVFLDLGIRTQGVKHLLRLCADGLICGHQGQIRVQQGGFLVVVAGADLGGVVNAGAALLGDEQQLGMHLERPGAVDHLTACTL